MGKRFRSEQPSQQVDHVTSRLEDKQLFIDDHCVTSDTTMYNTREGTRIANIESLKKHLLVKLDDKCRSIEGNSVTLTRYIGKKARNPLFLPLNYITWKEVLAGSKKTVLDIIKAKFIFTDEVETKKAEKWIMRKLNMAWKSYKNILKSTYYDPYPSDAISIQKITDQKDGDQRVDLDQWKWLLEY